MKRCRRNPEDLRRYRSSETEADRVMHSAMAKLFREEPDAKQIIKLKEIYQLLESVTRRSAKMSRNLIEGIVLENA